MNSLFALIAVDLDAARIVFSKFKIKEMESAVVAAVVGIGLFMAPMESVQGQSVPFYVTEVDLDSFSFSTAEEDLAMSISVSGSYFRIPVFFWSGIYDLGGWWRWLSVTGSAEDVRRGRANLGPAQVRYYYPGNRSDYYVCRFGYLDTSAGGFSIDEDSGWVEVWVWTGTATDSPSAYVYDSDGNFYYVDLAIDGYVISGPSTE